MTSLKNRLFQAASLLIVALMIPLHAAAQEASLEAPDALMRRISAEVLDIAQNDPAIKRGDITRIAKVIEEKIMPHVDFDKTTSLTVGRFWRQATPAQRTELSKQFHNLLFHTYANAMSKVKEGSTLEVQTLRIRPETTDAVVNTRIRVPKNPEPIPLSYRLEKQADGWKVYDISVLGAWLVESYRTTFTNEIERNGIDGLIRTLREKNEGLAKGSS